MNITKHRERVAEARSLNLGRRINDPRFITLVKPRAIVIGYLAFSGRHYVDVAGSITKCYKNRDYTAQVDDIFRKLRALSIRTDGFGQDHLPDTRQVNDLIASLP